MVVVREKSQKLYSQIFDILKKNIEDGTWHVDSQIPTEDNLCSIYGVSKATIRFALSELARQGYLKRIQGKGTFVCKRMASGGLRLYANLEDFMLEAGSNCTTKVLAHTVMMPTDDLDIQIKVSSKQHLVYIKRLRKAGKDPVLLQEIYIPYHLCPPILQEDLEKESVIELLEKKHGIPITTVQDFFSITSLNGEESRIFGMEQGTAALLLTRIFYSGETGIMYCRSVKRPGSPRFHVEFDRESP